MNQRNLVEAQSTRRGLLAFDLWPQSLASDEVYSQGAATGRAEPTNLDEVRFHEQGTADGLAVKLYAIALRCGRPDPGARFTVVTFAGCADSITAKWVAALEFGVAPGRWCRPRADAALTNPSRSEHIANIAIPSPLQGSSM
jgi:hypothetical protein